MDKDLYFDDEEFVEIESDENHLKGASIALLVIVAICSLIVLSIVILSPPPKYSEFNNEVFKIEEILNNEFEAKLFNGTWISGHEFIFKAEDNRIVVFDAIANITRTIVHDYIVSQYNVQSYRLSSDRNYILLVSNRKKSLHLSLSAQFVVYGINNGDIVHLESVLQKGSRVELQWAEWAPTGNALAFIHNNNIYYMPYIGAKPKAITNDGKPGVVFNGLSDLLYRDIISRESLLWWSKEGSSLAFARIDSSDVVDSTLVIYGAVDNRTDDSIGFVRYKYPKAKQSIPKISLMAYNLNSSAAKQIIPPKVLSNKEFYLTHVNWVKEDLMTVVWSLRNQSDSVIGRCFGGQQWTCDEALKFSSALTLKQLSASVVASSDGLKYLMISVRPDTQIGAYYQISHFRLDGKFAESFITFGDFDVTKLIFYDQSSQFVYFEAKQSIVTEKHVYRVKTNDSKALQCLSCHLTSSDCRYFEAFFSTTADHCVVQCMGPGVPKVYLFRLTDLTEAFNATEGTQANDGTFQLEDNEWLTNKMRTKLELNQRYFTVVSDLKKIYIRLLLPPDFDDEVVGKYPLIIESHDPLYSPFEQTFGIGWSHNFVSQYEWIYGWIQRDRSLQRHNKRNHNYEPIVEGIENLKIAFKYIKENLLFIDSGRVCVIGEAMGAFVAASSLTADEAVGCALLISPIVNWRLIDALTFDYLFNDNSYENYALLEGMTLDNRIDALIDKHILVIHGSADEFVTIQHSMQLIKQTIAEYSKNGWNRTQTLLQTQIYPDEDHSLSSVRHHMLATIKRFLEQRFAQNPNKP